MGRAPVLKLHAGLLQLRSWAYRSVLRLNIQSPSTAQAPLPVLSDPCFPGKAANLTLRLCAGILGKDDAIPCPVDADGCYTEEVPEFKGRHVKDADADIIQLLKARGALIANARIVHNVPFCPRSETPLIYKVPALPRIRAFFPDALGAEDGQSQCFVLCMLHILLPYSTWRLTSQACIPA